MKQKKDLILSPNIIEDRRPRIVENSFRYKRETSFWNIFYTILAHKPKFFNDQNQLHYRESTFLRKSNVKIKVILDVHTWNYSLMRLREISIFLSKFDYFERGRWAGLIRLNLVVFFYYKYIGDIKLLCKTSNSFGTREKNPWDWWKWAAYSESTIKTDEEAVWSDSKLWTSYSADKTRKCLKV